MVRKTKLKKLCMGIMAASVAITSLAPVSSIEVQAEEAGTWTPDNNTPAPNPGGNNEGTPNPPAQGPVIPTDEKGFMKNADGTLTFYIYANDDENVPLVFCGFNRTNPVLSELGGYVMEKVNNVPNLYTYTLPNNGDTVSYMYGYTPVGETGRRDTAIVTESTR